MRQWVQSLTILVAVSVGAGGPVQAQSGKKAAGAAESKSKDDSKTKASTTKKKTKGSQAASTAAATQPKPGTAAPDARATSLYRSAENLEKSGKSPGAINLYRDLLIRYPTSPEASQVTARLKALGGKIPDPSEIHPAPPPEEAKFVRAPKPKYASQAANRDALNQAIGGMVGGAMSQPAGGGGGYGGGAPYAP
jgi:hypothetical protein